MSWIKSFNKFKFSQRPLLCLLLLALPQPAQSAACCGGALALPSLITGDEGAKLTGTWSASQLQTDVYDNGIWRRREEPEAGQVFRFEGAQVFAERWQYGAGLPIQQRSRTGASSSGLGDLTAQLGFEVLPEIEEGPELPRVLSFLSLTAPTGVSIYDSTDPQALDSRGRGFWSLGAGSVVSKAWIRWDANAALTFHRSFWMAAEIQ
jgi:hypothetical protein